MRGEIGRPSCEDTALARLTLPVVILWPLFVYFLLSKSPSTNKKIAYEAELVKKYAKDVENKAFAQAKQLRGQVKEFISASGINYWQHHEWMGYGAHLPRSAIVIVGSDVEAVVRSTASVFRSTDRNRILTLVAVLDGILEESSIESQFADIDKGMTAHFHGPFGVGEKESKVKGDSDFQAPNHSKKIHVIFNPTKQGVSASRQSAVDFITLLSKQLSNGGLKEQEEDIILLLLRSDATLEYTGWLDSVTGALILPPSSSVPETADSTGSKQNLKVANAVAMAVDYIDSDADGSVGGASVTPGKIVRSAAGSYMGFGLNLQFEWKKLSSENVMYLESYMTPAVLGPATAMRLSVFTNLPARDLDLKSQYAADMELSLNLWLCADGIDVLPTARVVVNPSFLPGSDEQISKDESARILAAWMDKPHQQRISQLLGDSDSFARLVQRASDSDTLPQNLKQKCRSFKWYSEEVNRDVLLPVNDASTPKVEPSIDTNDAKDRGHNSEKSQVAYLTSEQQEIVRQAKKQSIVFEDLSNGGLDHPHLGAKNEWGAQGYTHDETALRKDPPIFIPLEKSVSCKDDNHYKMLTQKVRVDFDGDKRAILAGKPRAKIFCIVYTIEKYHDKLEAIRETWAPKCDGFMIASTKTDLALGTVQIDHEGEEKYENIWQKIRSVWSYVYDNYYNVYDWFHIGGDDLYLIVENLRLYLESDTIRSAANGGSDPLRSWTEPYQTPLFLGRRFAEQGNMERIFNSGGSGYTINKAALKALVRSFSTCMPHLQTFAEDVMVAQCFRKQGILPFPTRDEQGGERYMPFLPGHHYGYRPPENGNDWYPKYAVEELKIGLDHCAEMSVAFHYASPDLMKRIHAILYGFCKR